VFHTIGETAGEIWSILKAEGALSLSGIVNKTKRPQATVYMAIGWLAREDKLLFSQTKRGMLISIKR
jgi:hypothetical protein